MSQYSEEELQNIMAEVIRDKAREKLDEDKLSQDYALINKGLEDSDLVHPIFGKCIASFSLDEYTHIAQHYGADFFNDDESIRFHQKVRGQEFLQRV